MKFLAEFVADLFGLFNVRYFFQSFALKNTLDHNCAVLSYFSYIITYRRASVSFLNKIFYCTNKNNRVTGLRLFFLCKSGNAGCLGDYICICHNQMSTMLKLITLSATNFGCGNLEMTIFVERSLVQLNAKTLEELVSHSKLNYTAVIAEESQVYIFEEVMVNVIQINVFAV